MKISNTKADWKESYRIGVPILDAEHKNLFLAINTYIERVNRNQGLKYSRAVLDALGDYARTHFKREEGMMRARGYPGYAEHKACHNKF
ncbi:MAG: hemerythrin domain-containing protein [Rhodospirillaceae bacterium]